MAKQYSTLTKEFLQNLFDYRDGELYWKNKTYKTARIKIGSLAGSTHPNGYKYVAINKKTYAVHRIIFLLNHGFLPKFVDHIDCNKSNNKIENLREATKIQNCQNAKLSKANKTGFKNVYWHKKSKKWFVKIRINNKGIYFGEYKDIDYAKFIANIMRYKYHKEFANNG